ncbi:phage transcriptional regulator AlpA [Catenovulum agarivorans DS-2]|uniref:Phage transcriptional regulator AlpA n=1 Tax=Catenovulum agarivorans DS-2 TaxID=1328313 RepID=W7QJA9_9ALTE|nr:AlpA family transcriptional regulator [Catenovulum agarivorans]EWH09032.1 phage transcriptional regulator AlpA [Catenovulum agarivorans DS-2]
MTRLIKLKTVLNVTGLGRSTLYEYVKNGQFPKPVDLGIRNVAWVESEVEEWIQQRIAARK